ncbi:very short patch repair endonuclease [Lentzea californiensis]|uniref:very short patch repair endonuclease n=1 Tax=Lentzea californiensis TaxID=438851 RepID=UPI002165EAD2|nr:very short patch repair endonuclease [Lentzea californiensis]MCR3749748.1 T/G mismatch-specific endonuclease [Lentzea californiensis]
MSIERPTKAANAGVRRSMQSNKSRDTKPELAIRRLLHARGLRYRVSYRPLPGVRRTADIVFTRLKVAVFVDGCFWHGCEEHHTVAATNATYWAEKVRGNRERDQETDQMLRDAGWLPVRIWEHQDPATAVEQISALVESSGERGAPPSTPE